MKFCSNDGSKHTSRHLAMFLVIQTTSKQVSLTKGSSLSPEDELGAAEAVWKL
jgi:hypothetical protein